MIEYSIWGIISPFLCPVTLLSVSEVCSGSRQATRPDRERVRLGCGLGGDEYGATSTRISLMKASVTSRGYLGWATPRMSLTPFERSVLYACHPDLPVEDGDSRAVETLRNLSGTEAFETVARRYAGRTDIMRRAGSACMAEVRDPGMQRLLLAESVVLPRDLVRAAARRGDGALAAILAPSQTPVGASESALVALEADAPCVLDSLVPSPLGVHFIEPAFMLGADKCLSRLLDLLPPGSHPDAYFSVEGAVDHCCSGLPGHLGCFSQLLGCCSRGGVPPDDPRLIPGYARFGMLSRLPARPPSGERDRRRAIYMACASGHPGALEWASKASAPGGPGDALFFELVCLLKSGYGAASALRDMSPSSRAGAEAELVIMYCLISEDPGSLEGLLSDHPGYAAILEAMDVGAWLESVRGVQGVAASPEAILCAVGAGAHPGEREVIAAAASSRSAPVFRGLLDALAETPSGVRRLLPLLDRDHRHVASLWEESRRGDPSDL